MIWPFKRNTADVIGYIKDQKGIKRRYMREKSNWDSHLTNTQDYISKQISGLSFNKIAVFGSGYLLDLPIDTLLKYCSEIHLFDVHHPNEIISRYKSNEKIHFIEKDITEIADSIRIVKNESELIDLIDNHNFQSEYHDFDLLISLNILNQLDILLIDFLKQKITFSVETENRLRSKIQSDHIKMLLNSMSLLIADIEEIHEYTSSKKSVVTNNLFTEIFLENKASDIDEWKWSFDEAGYYSEDAAVSFNVHALTYNKRHN